MALNDEDFQGSYADTARVKNLINDIEKTRQCLFNQIRTLSKK